MAPVKSEGKEVPNKTAEKLTESIDRFVKGSRNQLFHHRSYNEASLL